MSRLIVVSNRLPASVKITKGAVRLESSSGGLATALSSVFDPQREHVWIGWPGTFVSGESQRQEVTQRLRADGMWPVFLSKADIENFYLGFSNRTVWPLFHYFVVYTVYSEAYWRSYERVNRQFMDEILKVAQPDDTFWVHDYQLMLLPAMIREAFPQANIGFFLHIPFPSYELFRMMPWREELLKGMLGADLVGFHTYDYVRHFLSACNRILQTRDKLGQLRYRDRVVDVDAFPISIDYPKFFDAPLQRGAQQQLKKLDAELNGQRLLLSIDRLDYTKGILQRLKALDHLLETHPEYVGKVKLFAIVVPSRDAVEHYALLKSEIDQYVGYLNGKYGSVGWVPVHYMYSSVKFDTLVALYHRADVMIVTPFRDGMNLVAKEYVVAKRNRPGVLILSEMAGAAYEMGSGALAINPSYTDSIAAALHTALQMPEQEQLRRLRDMQRVIANYDVGHWATTFMNQLSEATVDREAMTARLLENGRLNGLLQAFRQAAHRLILLDYDGTLRDFERLPQDALPDEALLELLRTLARTPHTDVVIISGRDHQTLASWFGTLPVRIIGEHGMWVRHENGDWQRSDHYREPAPGWMEQVLQLMEVFTHRTPGSLVERKAHSVAWHYRAVDATLGEQRAHALHDALLPMTNDQPLHVLRGDRVLEVRSATVNKGLAAMNLVDQVHPDFILAIGDDYTDEDIFNALPKSAFTVKVGLKETVARHYLRDVTHVRGFLAQLVAGATGSPDTVPEAQAQSRS